MDVSLSIKRIRRWGVTGGLGILDQVFFSGANFVFNVLLARWLMPTDYGAFAISFTILLIFYQLHSSLLLDPMSILGPAQHAQRLYAYFGEQVRLHFFVTIVFGATIFSGALIYHQLLSTDNPVGRVLMIMGLTLPFHLLPWLLRRMFYIVQKPGVATLGSLVYALINILSLLILHKVALLTPIAAVIAMAISGLGGSFIMFFWLKADKHADETKSMTTLFKQNWFIASWLVASAILVAIAGQAQILIAGSVLNVEFAGIVRALQNLAQPMILVVTAFGNLAIPTLSADFGRGDFANFRRKASLIAFTSISMASIYWLLLLIFHEPLEFLLYGGKYASYSKLIPVWGIIPLLLAINVAPASALQAFQRPYALLVVSIFWVTSSVITAYLFSIWWGIWGITASAVLGYFVAVTVFAVLYKIWVANEIASTNS